MKETYITNDTTGEERARVEAWNRIYAQAKGDHNQAQTGVRRGAVAGRVRQRS